MKRTKRAVDQAMAEERPEKQTIRSLWINAIREIATLYPNSEVPWYLTLPGAEGHDIQRIIDEGIITLTEVNSIVEKDQDKIVAVESNNSAVLSLQKKFIGLRIKETHFQNLIRGERNFSWPECEEQKFCRARIVNLDLNAPLMAEIDEGQVVFPVLAWIKKLCALHAKPPRTDWTLCLTLHAGLGWPEAVNGWTKDFLIENLGREPSFSDGCRKFFGEGLFKLVTEHDKIEFSQLSRENQQRLLMVMVPKVIAHFVHNEGWRVITEQNLRYGGKGKQAAMVTWIIKFSCDPKASATPDYLYRYALSNILGSVGVVDSDGQVIQESH